MGPCAAADFADVFVATGAVCTAGVSVSVLGAVSVLPPLAPCVLLALTLSCFVRSLVADTAVSVSALAASLADWVAVLAGVAVSVMSEDTSCVNC